MSKLLRLVFGATILLIGISSKADQLQPLIALHTGDATRRATVADVIYYNGAVETLDGSFTHAEALAVAGDRILEVGRRSDVMLHSGPDTRMVNLKGRALLPGWVDPHTHLFNDAERVGLTLGEAQQLAIENGVTTIGDLFVPETLVAAMTDFAGSGQLKIRTSLYLVRTSNCGVLYPDWYKTYAPNRDPEALLRIPGIKIFSDGGSCLLPATTFEYILPEGPTHGDLFFEQADLEALIGEADALGYQVAVHAIGDRARDAALGAFESVLAGRPNVLRHRIEHANWVRPDQIERYRRSGVLATGYIDLTCSVNAGNALANLAPEFARPWYRPWREMLDAGVTLAWHGDWPFRTIDAIQHLYYLVTRREVDADGGICEPFDWVAAGAVTVPEALRMMTLTAAYALHMDGVVGSLEPGKFADLIVLSEDPLDVDPATLKDLRVLSTVIGGGPLFCGAGHEDLCH